MPRYVNKQIFLQAPCSRDNAKPGLTFLRCTIEKKFNFDANSQLSTTFVVHTPLPENRYLILNLKQSQNPRAINDIDLDEQFDSSLENLFSVFSSHVSSFYEVFNDIHQLTFVKFMM